MLVGSLLGLPPTDPIVEAAAQNVVPEAPNVPTFVLRGTHSEPRISLEGELPALVLELEQPRMELFDHGHMIQRSALGFPRLTITCQCAFAIRDERR